MKQYSKKLVLMVGISLAFGSAAQSLAEPVSAPAEAKSTYTHPAEIRGFNPQPEPPARTMQAGGTSTFESPQTVRGFNPQPEPPALRQGFNPQPEPPARFNAHSTTR
ncbi:MAG: hypothetical protein WC314_05305 [Vulcanimicrobiota bacterium]